MGTIIIWIIFLPALIMCGGGAIVGIIAVLSRDREYTNSQNLDASVLTIIFFIIGAIFSFFILRAA